MAGSRILDTSSSSHDWTILAECELKSIRATRKLLYKEQILLHKQLLRIEGAKREALRHRNHQEALMRKELEKKKKKMQSYLSREYTPDKINRVSERRYAIPQPTASEKRGHLPQPTVSETRYTITQPAAFRQAAYQQRKSLPTENQQATEQQIQQQQQQELQQQHSLLQQQYLNTTPVRQQHPNCIPEKNRPLISSGLPQVARRRRTVTFAETPLLTKSLMIQQSDSPDKDAITETRLANLPEINVSTGNVSESSNVMPQIQFRLPKLKRSNTEPVLSTIEITKAAAMHDSRTRRLSITRPSKRDLQMALVVALPRHHIHSIDEEAGILPDISSQSGVIYKPFYQQVKN